MSAIAGIYNPNKEPIPISHSNVMMQSLQKFPSDDMQIWQHDNVFLGCHAQWITPESVGEPLPYYDHERQLAITADAIIDNRLELFDRLQVDRSKRKGIPDSQLILLAYQKWGEKTPEYLIGDFAFMIWDERQNKLFGARDFSGTRTLYYYHKASHFAFCTVMEPLLTLPYIEKVLNEQWLAEFLAIPNMIDAVNGKISVIKDVNQVPPAHSITVVEDKVSLSRYCKLEVNEKLKFKKEEDYIEAFKDIFIKSVYDRTRTYRSVGSQLSGGLDSGAVVGIAAEAMKGKNKKLHTFSYIPESDFKDWTPKHRLADESPYINSTIKYVGNIEKHLLNFEGYSPLTEMDDWLEIMEMPYKFFENSTWLKGIYENAHDKGIGILLNGGRGNFSVSWGPAMDYYSMLLKKMKWIRLYREVNKYSENTGIVSKSKIYALIRKKAFPYFEEKGKSSYQLPTIINYEFAEKTQVFDVIRKHGIDTDGSSKMNNYDARKYHFEKTFMWNTTGTSNTKLSLRHALWNRDPTNDIRVIQFCLAVPEEQYVKDGVDRALIRKATEGILPDNVRLNQRIRGIQGADWIHRMAPDWHLFLKELNQLVLDPVISEYINIPFIRTAISKLGEVPRLEYAFDPELRVLMRSLIVYRFLKDFYYKGGDNDEKRMAKACIRSAGY